MIRLRRSRLGWRRRMNAKRVLIPSLVRQLRSFSSIRLHSSRAKDQRQARIFSGALHERMDMTRRIHTVRMSHFKLSDGASVSSCEGGTGRNPLRDNSIQLADKGGFQMPIHTLAVHTKENKPMLDCTSELRAEFEMIILYFQNMPAALKDLPKMDPNGIYANHNLRLDRINVFGFDYDYTLAHYTSDLQTLIYDLAKHHLVKEHRYPDSCLKFDYDKGFPIRGLYYDKKKGYLLKLDFFHSVESDCCYFGRRKVEESEIEAVYGGKRISAEHMPNLVALMDLFCLSEVCLISDVIDHFVKTNIDFDASYVYDDVKRSIEFVHKSGLLHKKILEEPSKYLVKSQGVVQMLRNLKSSGKSLFLLTNSPFPFVDGGMKYMFEEEAASGGSWRDLFDVVIALADKPHFYTSERPFRHYNSKRDVLAFSKVASFQSHSVYYHGCLKHFLEITKWKGPEVLYFGDHLYSDLRGPAKAGWRTAAIIRELEREIRTQNEDAYRFHQESGRSFVYSLVEWSFFSGGDYDTLRNSTSISGDISLGAYGRDVEMGCFSLGYKITVSVWLVCSFASGCTGRKDQSREETEILEQKERWRTRHEKSFSFLTRLFQLCISILFGSNHSSTRTCFGPRPTKPKTICETF